MIARAFVIPRLCWGKRCMCFGFAQSEEFTAVIDRHFIAIGRLITINRPGHIINRTELWPAWWFGGDSQG